MPATLTLEASKKVRELLGDTEKTRMLWSESNIGEYGLRVCRDGSTYSEDDINAPDFGETIRLLPLIAEKKGWPPYPMSPAVNFHASPPTADELARRFLYRYMKASSPEEGMRLISEEIMRLV